MDLHHTLDPLATSFALMSIHKETYFSFWNAHENHSTRKYPYLRLV